MKITQHNMKSLSLPLLLFLITAFQLQLLSCRQIYNDITSCVACLGSLYPMCSTNTTVYSCRSNAADTDCKTGTFKTNLLSTCHNVNGTNILSADSQCFDTYYITKDYFGSKNARTVSVTLAKNQICPIQIINQVGNDIPGILTITFNNRANLTYLATNSTEMYFNKTSDYEMTNYTLVTNTSFSISENKGVTFIASNPFTNGTPTIFEITYQGAEGLKMGRWLILMGLIFTLSQYVQII
eukprot:403345722